MGHDDQTGLGALLGELTGVNPEAAQNLDDAGQAQRGAEELQQDLTHQGTDPSYINEVEHWDGLSHQDIYDKAQGFKPATMHTHGQAWQDIAASIGGGLFGLNLSIHKELSNGFQGQFAGAAQDAAQKFIQQATGVQDVVSIVSTRIHAAAYGAEAAKLAVPAPGQRTNIGAGGLADLLPGAPTPAQEIENRKQAEEQRQLAVTAMRNNYNPTYQPAGERVPTFVPVDSPGDAGPNSSDSGGTNSSNSGPTTPGQPTSPNGEQKPGDEQKPGQNEGADPGKAEQTDPASTSPAGQGNQNSTPGSSLPGSETRPTGVDSTSAAGLGGGPGSSLGSSGGPGGLGGSNAGQAGGPGRSVPGVLGSGNPAAAAAFGGRPGQPGLGGMPGMGGLGGARRSEDSEKEHETPDYLIRDREDELIGHIDPQVPGAIGENIPAAQFRRDEGEERRR